MHDFLSDSRQRDATILKTQLSIEIVKMQTIIEIPISFCPRLHIRDHKTDRRMRDILYSTYFFHEKIISRLQNGTPKFYYPTFHPDQIAR